MNGLELTDKDNTIIDVDRIEAISKKPRTKYYVIQIYFRNRENIMNVHYDTNSQAMVDHQRILSKMENE